MKFAVAIVNARLEKFRQNIVGVGRAENTFNRQSHAFCVVGGKDISKIAGRYDDIHLFAEFNLFSLDKICV